MADDSGMIGVDTPIDRLKVLELEMNTVFIDRADVIRATLVAVLAQTNIFMLGKPGVGKTQIAKTIARHMGLQSRYQLFRADTMPSEFIGTKEVVETPTNDGGKITTFRLNQEGGLLDSDLFIGDELFKASSPALNGMLGALLRDEGRLMSFVGMSNELPKNESLLAFWDRFPLRVNVPELGMSDRRKLAVRKIGSKIPNIKTVLTRDDVQYMQSQVNSVKVPTSVLNIYFDCLKALSLRGITVSVRQDEQLIQCLKANALIEGRSAASTKDLGILAMSMWGNNDQQKIVAEKFVEAAIDPDKALEQEWAQISDAVSDLLKQGSGASSVKASMASKLRSVISSIESGGRCTECSSDARDSFVKNCQSAIGQLQQMASTQKV